MNNALIERVAKCLNIELWRSELGEVMYSHSNNPFYKEIRYMETLHEEFDPENDAELFKRCLKELVDNSFTELENLNPGYAVTCDDIESIGVTLEISVYTAWCELQESK